ncbi:MAG: hypothetical protein ACLGIG_03150 [Actinomycetes bacterium]
MLKKLTLAAGFAAGYVLGAKAGTQRYEEIVAKAREIAGMPAVKNATATVQDTAGSLAEKAKDTVNDKVSKGSDGDASDVAGATGTGASTTPRTTTRTTAAAGAAPSATAPVTRP